MSKRRVINGYILMHLPTHHRAFTVGAAGRNGHAGFVYEHVVVAERMLGRRLRADEEVHHLDFDRSNNSPSNILVMLNTQHAKLHEWFRRRPNILGQPILSRMAITAMQQHDRLRHGQFTIAKIPRCRRCLFPVETGLKFCSQICNHAMTRKIPDSLTRERLVNLVKKHSWSKIARHYGVSDNAVRKHAKRLGLDPNMIKFM